MKPVSTVAIAAVVATGLAALAPDAAQTRELVYGSFVSDKHGLAAYALPRYFKAVKEQTNGEITWKHLGSSQIVNARSGLSGAGDGLVDAAFAIAAYTPSAIPSVSMLHSTLLPGTDVVGYTGAALETMFLHCPSCLKEFRNNNTVPIAGYDASPYYPICKKKIETLEGFKGVKIRAFGGGVLLWEMIGATPVGMSPAEATTALQRGTLDCSHGALSWLKSYGYQDVTKYVTDFPSGIAGPALAMVMSRDTWNSLTPEQQRTHFMNAPKIVASTVIKAYIEEDKQVLAAAKEQHGVQVVPTGEEFDELFKRFEARQRKENIESTEEFGVEDAEAIFEALEKAQKKWRKLSEDIGTDVKKFEEALTREVYSKVDIDKL